MRNRSIALTLAVMALFATTSVVAAGGWAEVSAKNVPVDPPAGEETTIDLRVLQHGKTPVSWPKLVVVATNEASGDVVRATAKAEGPEGSYVVTLTFPTSGAWSLSYESADLVMDGSATVQVAAGAAAAAAAGAGAGSKASLGFDVMPLLFVLLMIGAVLVAFGLGLKGREAPADSPVSART